MVGTAPDSGGLLRDGLVCQKERADRVAEAAQEVYKRNTWKQEKWQRMQFSIVFVVYALVMAVLRGTVGLYEHWSVVSQTVLAVGDFFLGAILLFVSHKVSYFAIITNRFV